VLAVLVFILAVMWSVYIGMALLSRRERRSMNSIATFNKHLAVLARAAPARTGGSLPPAYAPRPTGMTLTDARNRRRQILTALAAASSVTAAMAFFFGGVLVVLHVLVDLALGAYVVLLVRTQQAVVERRSKVVYLPRPVTPVALEPAYLQRSAN